MRPEQVTVALLVGVLQASLSYAEPPPGLPFADEPARLDRERRVVSAAAVGLPDASVSRLSAAMEGARRLARRRALGQIHRFVDDALASVHCVPWHASRVHAAVDGAAAVTAVRPLFDGGAVVRVEVPFGVLDAALPAQGLPWS